MEARLGFAAFRGTKLAPLPYPLVKARAGLIGDAEDGTRARPGERRARRDRVACVAMPGPID